MQVTVYDGETCKVKKTISRFTDVVSFNFAAFKTSSQVIVVIGYILQLSAEFPFHQWNIYSLQENPTNLVGKINISLRFIHSSISKTSC